jgi:hypothetical protein
VGFDEIPDIGAFDLRSKLGVSNEIRLGVIVMMLSSMAMIHVQNPPVNSKIDSADATYLFAVEVEMMIAKLDPTQFPFECGRAYPEIG